MPTFHRVIIATILTLTFGMAAAADDNIINSPPQEIGMSLPKDIQRALPPITVVVNLGMIKIQSYEGYYLQARADNGDLHDSRMRANQETWFLIQVEATKHIYALYNWENGKFLSKTSNGCATASSTALGPTEKWILESGRPFGMGHSVIVRSAYDSTILNTNPAGQNDSTCHGEIVARDNWSKDGNAAGKLKIPSDYDWGGWWVISKAGIPEKGEKTWNSVGGAVLGISNNINPADIQTVFMALESGKN
ncbi:hypothetical protein QU487_21675 [Crenobacter sp. SG2305]|uniref:hypothetical protein n=1 Tax=Crenobacter oryzisoli TaxID=3056844 RepID=UPI0025AB3BB4|nr:hypothetical protein [Crenobacter sp. SG2305]MDN0085314.1 hypothetical protein [Crenobacter sp. SG2305]